MRPRWSETSRSQRHGYILSIPWGPASQMLSGLRSLRCVSMRVSKGHPLLCCLFTVKCSGGCRMPLEHLVMNIQVCGGNAGYLLRASRHFRTLKDWTQGGLCLLRGLSRQAVMCMPCEHASPCCSLEEDLAHTFERGGVWHQRRPPMEPKAVLHHLTACLRG